jgi:cytochrome c biogenesis protein CcmG, thiol:disulfide interchange protein DsbE
MRLSSVAFSVLLSGLVALPALAADVGTAAPSFTLEGIKNVTAGQKVSLANYKGKIVYVDFWASWCIPCQSSFPVLEKLREKYKSKGFEVVAINMDENLEDANKFLTKYPVSFPIARDAVGSVAEQYKVKGMPSAYILDAKGVVLHVIEGFNEAQETALIEASIKTLGGK